MTHLLSNEDFHLAMRLKSERDTAKHAVAQAQIDARKSMIDRAEAISTEYGKTRLFNEGPNMGALYESHSELLAELRRMEAEVWKP